MAKLAPRINLSAFTCGAKVKRRASVVIFRRLLEADKSLLIVFFALLLDHAPHLGRIPSSRSNIDLFRSVFPVESFN